MFLQRIASILGNDLLELLYPTHCLGCDRHGSWFCKLCTNASILHRSVDHCQICNRMVGRPGVLCPRHQDRLGLTGLVSFGDYHAEPLRRALHLAKYSGIWAGLPGLMAAGRERFQRAIDAKTWAGVVPIPLHPSRQRERGFNQAEVMAKALAEQFSRCHVERPKGVETSRLYHHRDPSTALGMTLRTDLVRTRSTEHQTELSREKRKQNVAGIFSWTGDRLTGPVLVVDDVLTTGATLGEAAQVLRHAGATQVWGLTLAYDV